MNVSAKDLGTGKEQQITITASTNLSKDEVDRMVTDAERQAAADKAKREDAEVRNNATSSLIYSTEKSLKEVGDKLDAGARGEVEAALERAQAQQRKRHDRRDQSRDREAAAGHLQDGRSALQDRGRANGEAERRILERRRRRRAARRATAARHPNGDVIDAEFKEAK